jgi:hypothetical protein
MLKFTLLLAILVFPHTSIAQCALEEPFWLDSFFNWVYQVFGDKVLKVFGCLYGLSTVFKVCSLLGEKLVLMTTWTNTDNIIIKKIYGHWSYRCLSILADLFLRLKLPKKH